LCLQTDASKSGLGACLMQDGRPVAYASRSMTPTELAYPQIEKEMLGICYGVQKFHQYIYGRRTQVQTDHKPLIAIVTKNINQISPRLQRMQLRLLKYDLEVVYLPGKLMYMADTLSRAYLPYSVRDDPELNVVVHSISKHLPMSDQRRAEFQAETNRCEVANTLRDLHYRGWPQHLSQVPSSVKHFWNVKEELSYDDGLVFVSDRLFVPATLRKRMLDLLHQGHFGMEKTKARARQVFSWPGMTNDINNMVASCATCERFRPKNAKEPLMPHTVPSRAWETIAADILEYKGNSYLVIKDYYSKWLELLHLKNKTAKELIGKFKSIFSRIGIPDMLMSDNMPFSSAEFKTFANTWHFQTKTSSPRYPKSNGMSENGVKIAKNMLKKAEFSNGELYLFLLEYRNMPITGLQVSPAQLLMSRKLKTCIPMATSHLQPCVQRDVVPALQALQCKQKMFHDRSAQALVPLEKGDNVVWRKDGVWEPAKIIDKHDTPRSYIIGTENGQVLRRNRRDLRKSVVCHRPDVTLSQPEENWVLPKINVHNEQPVLNGPTGDCNVTPEAPQVSEKVKASNNNKDVNQPCNNQTRSGRHVKPPARFNDYV
jgi:RNase H-like domain found in reverse transcriptase/Integrase zinc binding domain